MRRRATGPTTNIWAEHWKIAAPLISTSSCPHHCPIVRGSVHPYSSIFTIPPLPCSAGGAHAGGRRCRCQHSIHQCRRLCRGCGRWRWRLLPTALQSLLPPRVAQLSVWKLLPARQQLSSTTPFPQLTDADLKARDEVPDDFIRQLYQGVSDISDLNSGEKDFMTLWNKAATAAW